MEEVLNRIDALERTLTALLNSQALALGETAEREWLQAEEFSKLCGARNKGSLMHQLRQGIFDTTSVRNVGTTKRPRYLFHRHRALDQYLRKNV